MRARVANRLTTDAVNLISHDGMHLSGGAGHRKRDLCLGWTTPVSDGTLESFCQVVPLDGGSVQGIQRYPPFLHRLVQPDGQLLERAAMLDGIAGAFQNGIGKHL